MTLLHEELTGKIIQSALKVHSALGPGLLESVYEHCPAHELTKLGLSVRRQVDIPIVYDGEPLDAGFRADLIVEGVVLLELKAIDKLAPIHEAQLLTYLRLSGIHVGLLFNFNQLRVTDNMIRRVV
ncbi:hypothetical protein PHYC_00753 [Phycisphaerales bacterium]|nr:hypothetical protein PHYC_00753 [Phycisphaerales bacterium]